MKTTVWVLVFFILTITFPSDSQSANMFSVKPPLTKTMELIEYEPTILKVPFTVKYPGIWYAREESVEGGTTAVFFTREKVPGWYDEFEVGAAVQITPNYYKVEEPEEAQQEEWKKDTIRLVYGLAEHKDDQEVLTLEEKAFLGRPAVIVEVKKKNGDQVLMYYIKNNKERIDFFFTAPLSEFGEFRPIFMQMVASFHFVENGNKGEFKLLFDEVGEGALKK